jgi:voltage-gated potassium channel
MAAFRNSWGTLIDRLEQMEPSRREILLPSLTLLLLFAAGTVGYVLVEEWTVVESIYMTFIALSTIGFREVRPLANAGNPHHRPRPGRHWTPQLCRRPLRTISVRR